MIVSVFSSRPYERAMLDEACTPPHTLRHHEACLDVSTAALAAGAGAVCVFVNDRLDAGCLQHLSRLGIRGVALRCAGFNNVDLREAERLGMVVARVPAYSPNAVAEHTAALLLTLNRKTHRAYNRVREQNFSLDGLMGFDLVGKVVGVIGTGKIGACFARIMQGFGCRVLAADPNPDPSCVSSGVSYVSTETLLSQSDIVSLHCPLTPDTRHLINERSLSRMKNGAILLNTGRGALVDTRALISALKRGVLGGVGLDVYEEEADLFFSDLSGTIIQDDVFVRLMTFPNVLITAHQGFLTREAMRGITEMTAANLTAMEQGSTPPGLLRAPRPGV
jgi:D-lactate dehydrogenase